MKLTASQTKRLAALRAKATLNEEESAALAELEALTEEPTTTSGGVQNPPATIRIVGIAEIKLLHDRADEKPVLIRLVERIGGTDVLLLSERQANALAESINVFTPGIVGWRTMKAVVGNRRSEIELSVQKQLVGSTFKDRNGVVITRTEEGYSILPQSIILPMETQEKIDSLAVRAVHRTWTSSAKFVPEAAEEEVPF